MARKKASKAKGGLIVLSKERLMEEAKKYPEIDEDAKVKYEKFSEKFGSEKLKSLGDDEILSYIFYGTRDDNLCRTLEFDKYYMDFGSVAVQGGMYVYGLFKRKKDDKWCASKLFNGKDGELADQNESGRPLEIGKQIRDYLVGGAEVIKGWTRFDNVKDYKDLYEELKKTTNGMIEEMWFRKYYYLLFPDRFPQFYQDTFMSEVLTSIDCPDSDDIYEQTGRIACYTKECGISNRMMGHLYYMLVTSGKSVPRSNLEYSRNRIVFGAPGTGKSYLLDNQRRECFAEGHYERVTFHPDYSYANFVGTYKPVSECETMAMDDKVKNVLSVIHDDEKNTQEKYDELYNYFSEKNMKATLAILLGIYTEEEFKEKRKRGEGALDNNYSRNLGVSLRNFVELKDPKNTNGGEIKYRFVPGPFMRVYVEAKRNPKDPYLLMIEEINRADVSAVFGDVFQLLDRVDDEKDGILGESRYPIQASEDMKNYLTTQLGGKPSDYSEIRIPENMYIWATMNSADQGVFPLDTAFKRRWDFEYIGINDGDDKLKGKRVRLGRDGAQTVEWNALRKAINDCLASKKINEDKQLGPYFIETKALDADEENLRSEKFIKVFKDKVLMYLYEDAGRQIRQDLFGNNLRYSEICKKFDEDGVNVFCKEIREYKGVIVENPHAGKENGEPAERSN